MLPTNAKKRGGPPVTFAEALGAKDTGPLELNTVEAATCHACGAEPRLHVETSAKGREVMVWIPAEHRCTGRK